MDNISFFFDLNGNEHVLIDRGNGEFTSMLKEVYDAQQAEHLNGSDA